MQRILCFGRYATASPIVWLWPKCVELDVLRAVVEHVLVVEGDVGLLELVLLDVLAVLGRVLPLLRAVRLQQPGRVACWATILRPLLRPDAVAVGVVAVVVRVEDVLDRLVGRLLDGRDDVAGFLGEVGVDDDDVVLEDDPDVVAAAEGDLRVGGADGRVAEEDAGGDLLHVVELHLRDGELLRLVGSGCSRPRRRRGRDADPRRREERRGA